VLCVIGYLAGLAKPETGQLRTAAGPMFVVVGAAIGSTLLYAGVGALVGDTAAQHVGLGKLLFTAALYDLLLAPFTVPWIMALARKLDNDPLTEDASGGFGGFGAASRIGGQRAGLLGRAGRVNGIAKGVRRP
jgi:hypothetical protein